MANFLVNGLKSKTGGGKSILKSYLTHLASDADEHIYYILTPDHNEYAEFNSNRMKIVETPRFFSKNSLFPFLYYYYFPNLIKDLRIDAILNYGDIIIRGSTPQLYLFDWPFGSHPDSVAWDRLDRLDYLYSKVKLFMFERNMKYADIVMAQSQVTMDRLKAIYGIERLEILPNAVSLDNLSDKNGKNFNLPADRIKCLYISYYYTHKNIEIFLDIAKIIRAKNLNYALVTTIAAEQHRGAARFLEQVRAERLEDIIINVGPVPGSEIASLFDQCDALLMPTLLESFSGSYVEAMHHRKPIFTSKLDFAEVVCGDAAFYFNPLDPEEIVAALDHAFADPQRIADAADRGAARLEGMWNWDMVYARTQELLKSLPTRKTAD